MRLGAPVHAENPDQWLAELARLGYRAAYWPAKSGAAADVERAYVAAAAKADIVLAEVGAWSNPISPDSAERTKALAHCQSQLALADRVGARCCVNIAGSRGEKWDGPHPSHFSADVFDLIVETTRAIVDAVRPTRTFYTLEPMPWCPPDSAESYEALLRAVDRPAFAVHFDPVNIVTSPRTYYANGQMIRDFIARLGPHIKSIHAKDTLLRPALTVHIDEVRPGLGTLDYRTFLREAARLDPDLPFMLEHLPSQEEYAAAAAYVRAVAKDTGTSL